MKNKNKIMRKDFLRLEKLIRQDLQLFEYNFIVCNDIADAEINLKYLKIDFDAWVKLINMIQKK